MDKLIPILIVLGVIVLGFIMKRIEINDIVKRTDFTSTYRNKFIDYLNGIMADARFNQQLYYELTSDVKAMQYELGSDGVYAHVTDNLRGFSTSNYQLLVNFLPETREIINERSNSIMMMRYDKSAHDCDDMFIRHLGTLNELEKSMRKTLFNPFSCFSEGMKFIVALPILILNWLGFLSDEKTRKAKRSWFIRLLSFAVTIIGLVSAIVTIVIGWDEFWLRITELL